MKTYFCALVFSIPFFTPDKVMINSMHTVALVWNFECANLEIPLGKLHKVLEARNKA